MEYTWEDYQEKYRQTVESWLDKEARHGLGIDDGWQAYCDYWLSDEHTKPGINFWCKVILSGGEAVAAIALFLEDGVLQVSEIVVNDTLRGHGIGSQVLSELLTNSKNIIGLTIDKAESLIFLDNIASKRSFEKAGFEYSYTHTDGDALIYKYSKK